MALDTDQSTVRVTVVNPETPFGGVQIVGASSNGGESPDVPDIVVGVTDFLSLNDTPDSYEGQAGKLVAVNSEETALEFVTPSGGGGEGPDVGTLTIQNGTTALVISQTYVDVNFPVAQSNANWLLIECSILNNIDPTPVNVVTGILTSKTTTGFRLQLSGTANTSNYRLHWAVLGLPDTDIPGTGEARITTTGDSRITTNGDTRVIVASVAARITTLNDFRITLMGDSRII